MVVAVQVESRSAGVEEVVYLRPKEISRRYGPGLSLVYAALNSGQLRGRKLRDRIWLVEPKEVEEWIARESSVAE